MPFKDPLRQKEYAKKHYRENKHLYLKSNQKRRNLLRDYVRTIKSTTPCTDCGNSCPYYVMDFDHLRDKENIIVKFVRDNNKAGLENELLKCEVVCSNCHRVRSYQRLQAKKHSAKNIGQGQVTTNEA